MIKRILLNFTFGIFLTNKRPLSAAAATTYSTKCDDEEEISKYKARTRRRRLKARLDNFQPGFSGTYTKEQQSDDPMEGRKREENHSYMREEEHNIFFQPLKQTASKIPFWKCGEDIREEAEPWRRGWSSSTRPISSKNHKQKDKNKRSSKQHGSVQSSDEDSDPQWSPGAKGSDWFYKRWGTGAALNLDDLEDFFKNPGHSKGRRVRGVMNNEEGQWEDPAGPKYTDDPWKNRPLYPGKKQGYRRVTQDDERSWFQFWQDQEGGSSKQSWSSWQQKSNDTSGGQQRSTPLYHRNLQSMRHLQVLGLGSNTPLDKATLKSAFHQVAKQWHPDMHQGDQKPIAEHKFKIAADAYEALLKSATRD